MTRPRPSYTAAVLWLLRRLAPSVITTVFEDGIVAGHAIARKGTLARHGLDYANGFTAGLHAAGDHGGIEFLHSRTVGPTWNAPEGKRPA